MDPTLTTAVSIAGTLRLTIVCAPSRKWPSAIVVSVARCAPAPPWPPVPWKLTIQLSAAAMNGPGRVRNSPTGMPGMLCMP